MKIGNYKIALTLILIFTTIISCKDAVSDVFIDNKEDFKNLVNLIKENDIYFNNETKKPSIYYTYNFNKPYKDFILLNGKNKNISQKDFYLFQKYYTALKINELYFLDSNNVFFKVKENDYFIKTNLYFIGYIENESFFETYTFFDGMNYLSHHEVENKWFVLTYSSSMAN